MPVIAKIQDFLRLESAAGILLGLAALAALLISNSPIAPAYFAVFEMKAGFALGPLDLQKSVHHWINDGLMALFFLVVGLEVKRELLEGELSSRDKALLPAIAALGGVAAPAFVFVLINQGDAAALRGWAVPAATDIAFALGALALLGSKVPASLKVFLLAVAIIDDLAAIIIIAAFYAGDLSFVALGLAALCLLGLAGLARAGVRRTAPYLILGFLLWLCVLKSGVHATLAGVVTGLFMPLRGSTVGAPSPLHQLEHALHPYVAFGVLPVFAFANAGLSLDGVGWSTFADPIAAGVALGLFPGKQAGVFAFTAAAVRLGLARLPDGVSWVQVYGIACMTGVGFTMSLFIGSLAFDDPARLGAVKLGVLVGSLASAALSFLVLTISAKRTPAPAGAA